ncbi:hypothetical protein [Massilibacteroides vaginae]|uniref:hypothetical protein n=1 Tax=Massilibacteroides vaginae TaxID=1673718 RepID=UPI0037432D63
MLIGLAVGAIGGFLYWRLIGCSSGTCPITSSPIISSVWGALLGKCFSGTKICVRVIEERR